MTRAHIVSVALLALSAVAGCQAESFDRINEDGISFAALDSWAMHRERGSVVLSGGPAGFDKTRIVVRAVDVPQSQRNQTRRSPRRVFDATKQVLEALPDARVIGPFPDVHPSFRSARFSLSFASKDTGARTQRRHVVLVAPDQSQIVHVFVTAPDDTIDQSAAVFDEVVASLRKES